MEALQAANPRAAWPKVAYVWQGSQGWAAERGLGATCSSERQGGAVLRLLGSTQHSCRGPSSGPVSLTGDALAQALLLERIS